MKSVSDRIDVLYKKRWRIPDTVILSFADGSHKKTTLANAISELTNMDNPITKIEGSRFDKDGYLLDLITGLID